MLRGHFRQAVAKSTLCNITCLRRHSKRRWPLGPGQDMIPRSIQDLNISRTSLIKISMTVKILSSTPDQILLPIINISSHIYKNWTSSEMYIVYCIRSSLWLDNALYSVKNFPICLVFAVRPWMGSIMRSSHGTSAVICHHRAQVNVCAPSKYIKNDRLIMKPGVVASNIST